MWKIDVFIFANTSGVGGTNCKELKYPEPLQGIRESKHNFELYRTVAILNNHKIWCIYRLVTCIYIIFNKKNYLAKVFGTAIGSL